MDKVWNIQINIVLAIVLIILMVHASYNMSRAIKPNKVFLGIMGFTFLNTLCEAGDVMLNVPGLSEYRMFHIVINVVAFISAPCIPYLGCLFIKEWIDLYEREKINIKKYISYPLWINAIAAIASFGPYGAFYVTEDSLYQRGKFFWILPLVSYFYYLYSFYFICWYRRKIITSERIMFSVFYLSISIFTAVQLTFTNYLTIWSTAAIICIVIYVFILNDQAYRDVLTGLSNRLYYERYVQNFKNKKKQNICAVYIDLDKFKTINDLYGHKEGDEAIRIFTDKLKDSFTAKRKKMIRMGGDEFLILISGQNEETTKTYIDCLKTNIAVFNHAKVKPYQLGFSYGMAQYDNSYETIVQFLEHTDHLMYIDKQRMKN